MRTTLVIARRQLASYFNGPAAYIVVCLMLGFLGFFFWQTFFLQGVTSVRNLYELVSVMLVVAAPALTMNLIAEEKRTGSIELLLTMPVRDADVIVGKLLGVLGLYVVFLAITFVYPIAVSQFGNLDWGPVWSGYLGLFLQGAAMLSIGLLASSWTDNQVVAFFVGLILNFAFWFADRILPFLPRGLVTSVVEWLSFDRHLTPMTRGVVDTRDVVYFLSLTGFALLLAFRSLESRRWR
ncbi:MAG: ABC transporter permease [Myxococcota bacterium]|nr:ABC transporter permease [Myxococcota bacterium]MDW8361756.1 ABC transporter permease subunit [Myxococcales bacterium]